MVLVELQCALSRFSALEILGMVILGSLALQTLDCFRQKKKEVPGEVIGSARMNDNCSEYIQGQVFQCPTICDKGKSLRLLMRWLVAL